MIRYVLVDEDGQLQERDAGDYRQALAAVGPEGSDRVRLRPEAHMAAYVNDCGHVMPDRYRRNVVGACMLVSLRAAPQPYAGPVVFVGWDEHTGGVEVCSLTNQQIAMLQLLNTDVRRALGLDGGIPNAGTTWRNEIRRFAQWVPTAPTPGLTVLEDEDAIAALRAMGRLP